VASWLDRGFARRHALRYRIEAPLRRPWHVLVPAALVLVGAVTVGLLLPPRYRAAALVLGEWDTGGDAAMQSRGIDVAKRRSRDVLERVLDRAALERLVRRAELGPRNPVPAPGDALKWLDAVRVQPQGANAFRIECLQADATRAALIANLLATDLVERTNAQWQAAEPVARLGGRTVRFELLRKAGIPDTPESPGLWLFALAGAALGLLLGLAVALLAEVRDTTIKGPEDLAQVLPLPLLATIPLVRGGRSRQGG
jgi:uncharacterized protein involved in exopolysaccharide biosynthesis